MPTPPFKCVVVVPVYLNSSKLYPLIENCFATLSEHYPDLEIIGVDDGSPLPYLDWPIAIRLSPNQGFTKAVNRGLEEAFEEADVVIVANDDLSFRSGDLDRFFTLDPTVPTIASPRDTASDPTDRFGAIWGITRAAWDLLGPLDERYKHFFSDREYYDRAKEMGVTIVKWEDVIIDHQESATYKTVDKAALLAADQETYERTNRDNS